MRLSPSEPLSHMEALWIAIAFVLGLLARQVGLPPLVGYLAAGFTLSAFGQGDTGLLEPVAHVGVLLLLFSVGLKLNLGFILRSEVWGTALVHLVLIVPLLAAALSLVLDVGSPILLVVAVALGFSSTVVAAKVLEAKRELRAFHGRIAIGILITQDLIAVCLLAASGEHSPTPWSVALIALPLFSLPMARVLDFSGHGELLVLYGVLLALGFGAGFEAMGLSGELGALLAGAMLAKQPKAVELSNALWGLKEVFLVGFFLLIGLAGTPALSDLIVALLFCLLVPVKGALFFFILLNFRLRARTAFLTSVTLTSYSEFALIVARGLTESGYLSESWLAPLAITVAISYTLAAPLSRVAHDLYTRFEPQLLRFESTHKHPDEQPISLGDAGVVIMGMGRVGTAAYDFLNGRGEHVVGLDSDPGKVARHVNERRRVLFADAEDPGFWHKLHLHGVKAVVLAVPDLEAKVIAAKQLRSSGFAGLISATNVFADQAATITDAGADLTFNHFSEAGVGLAEHTWEALYPAANSTLGST